MCLVCLGVLLVWVSMWYGMCSGMIMCWCWLIFIGSMIFILY